MKSKESYKADVLTGQRARIQSGKEDRTTMQLGVTSTSQRPVSVFGWGIALTIGALLWLVLFLFLRA
jgi:hypothetical protein